MLLSLDKIQNISNLWSYLLFYFFKSLNMYVVQSLEKEQFTKTPKPHDIYAHSDC